MGRVAGRSKTGPPRFRADGRKEPRHGDPQRGYRGLSVARFPQGDVGGAVFGRVFQLDQPGAQPIRTELRGADLEVQIGLAARLGDLAPGRADLVALAGINPMIGGVFRGLVGRQDGQRGGDVEGLEDAGENALGQLSSVLHGRSSWILAAFQQRTVRGVFCAGSRRSNRSAAVGGGVASAGPDEGISTLNLDQAGVNRSGETGIIQLDGMVFAVGLLGGLFPTGADLDGACEGAQVGRLLTVLLGGNEAGLDVEGERLDDSGKRAIVIAGESSDLSHLSSPMLYPVATIAALMAIERRRATGPHPQGRSAAEGGTRPSLLPREEAARRRQPSTAGKKVGLVPLRDRGRAAPQPDAA